MLATAFVVLKTSRLISFGLAAVFIAMILPVSLMGYEITVPFLVLGAAALLGSAYVHALFAKARTLDVNAR